MSCFLDSLVSKVIDVVWDKTIVPVGRQFKYVLCYKSSIINMKAVDHDLEKKKKIVEESVKEASNNLRVITDEAKEWLQEVDKAHEEVRSLFNTYEQDQATRSSCIGQILNPIVRHQLGRKATKKKQTVEELLLKKPKSDEISSAPPPPGIVDHEVTTTAVAAKQQTEGVFRSSRWEEIMEEIMTALKDNTINVIGLYGMGGVGKSTMIREVYDQVKKQGMFDEVAYVEVKTKPEIKRIQEEIAFALGLKLENESSTIRAEQLRKRLLKTEKKKMVLLILDDLWEILDLREVGIPSGGNDQVQIKLLLTSRDNYLLSDKMMARDPIHLDVLSDADALRMFKFFVEGVAEDVAADILTETARKCRGLPIVIEVTAKALKDRALGEWEKILKRLDNVDVLEKLKVSYDYLPRKASKDLFLICGIVRGQRIPVKDLLKYTFGLGLYEGREDIQCLVDAESELDELLSGLEAASMLLKRDDNLYVNIHDYMRDLAVRIVDRDRLEWVHFTLKDDNYKLPRKFEAPKLELLLSYCEEGGSLQIPDSFFKDMKKLYVLEFTNLRGVLPSPTHLREHLRNLVTLCLHKCSLDDISMIGELKGLQVLSFRGSNIRKLPIQLRQLIALKMLDLSECKELTEIEPNVLAILTKLEELNMESSFNNWETEKVGDDMEVNSQDYSKSVRDMKPRNASLVELKNMSRLSNVKIHIPSTTMLPKEDQLFLSKLTTYKIMLGDVWDGKIASGRNESKVLMLKFDDSPDVLQKDWVQATLQRTEVLCLNGRLDGKCESISEICVKGFECLKHLQVIGCPLIRYIVSSNRGSNFMNLEWLSLERLENLEKLYDGLPREETFSKLKVIQVESCNKLTHLFDLSLLKCNSQLEDIIIRRSTEIRCIVIDADDKKDDILMLSNLQKLELRYLPKFSSFYVPKSPQSTVNVMFYGKKVAFPCLDSLFIDGLDELEYIWHPTDPPVELGQIRSLFVQSCNKLVSVINSHLLTINLESLNIRRCASIKHVFYLRYDHFLPGAGGFRLLKKVNIYFCEEIEAIIVMMMMGEEEDVHQQVTAIQYSSLKELNFYRCSKLKTFCWCNYSCGKSSEIMVATSTTDQDNIIGSSEQVPVDLPFFSQKETFPYLETLELARSNELRRIWPHEVVAAQRCFYNLKTLRIFHCPKLSAVLPSTLIDCLEKLESLHVGGCELIKSIIVDEKELIKLLKMESGGQNDDAIVHPNSNVETTMEMKFTTFPCLSELYLRRLPNLDRFHSSLSASVGFPLLETLRIFTCPKVKELFIQRLLPTTDLVRADNDDYLDYSNEIGTALFGYGDYKQAPNLKSLSLDDLENLTRIWKVVGQSDDEITCPDSIVKLQLDDELGRGGKVGELFCIRKLESLHLYKLPKLNLSIFMSNYNKCTVINKKLPPLPYIYEYVSFPSLQELRVSSCENVKLFGSDSSSSASTKKVVHLDNISTTSQQFLILSEKAIPLRSLAAEYNNCLVELTIDDKHEMMRFGQQKQHLHLTLKYCKSSSSNSIMNVLPLSSPSFCNVLTRLTVDWSHGLEYVLTPVGATSLVHLTYLSITCCDNMKEVIVVAEDEEEVIDINENNGQGQAGKSGDIIREEITFNHLKELTLRDLNSIESFSSSLSINLNFPCLDKLTIQYCPKMRFFSNPNGGVLTTPKLHQANWSEWNDKDQSQLIEDLNTTIQNKYAAAV